VVVSGLEETVADKPSERQLGDETKVQDLLDACKIQCRPAGIFRMGMVPTSRKGGLGGNTGADARPRLLKVKFYSRRLARDFLAAAKNLGHSAIRVRPSLSWEERNNRKNLQAECSKKRLDTGEDFVIYAGLIIARSEIPKIRNNK
jgi:hypothetical protein